jgi:hypothetical protein
VHRRYNPEGISSYNIVPGLMGVILTMTMIMMTALAVTREVERGTMENLLATPVRPLEVMLGKLLPFVVIGNIQVLVILLAASTIFQVPLVGSLTLLLLISQAFIMANLAVGISVSTAVGNQMQAMQSTFFFFLPSILLSGFMFPFRGMPEWAQAIGNVLPLTHYLRLVRGILLKGNGIAEVWVKSMVVIAVSSRDRIGSRRVGVEVVAGEAQVDVVEGRATDGQGGDGDAAVLDRVAHRCGPVLGDGDGHGRADGEALLLVHAGPAQVVEGLAAATGHPQLDDGAGERGDQPGRRVDGDDPATVDDRDPVAQALGLVEQVGGEDDGHPGAVPQPGDQIEEVGPDARVEPDGRFVQEEDARTREQGAADLEPAALAAAVGPDGSVHDRPEIEPVDEVVHCPDGLGA